MTGDGPLGSRAADIIQHPLVLQCAWYKLCDQHRLPWMRDPEEWALWRADPWANIIRVASALAQGTYFPDPFRYLPYPKKGGKIRQYLRPSVQDEFAFLLIGVVLAPLLEARMWPFSFGGRWYRGIVRRPPTPEEDPHQPWRFHSLPYALSDRHLFQSYRRSYGLFRRVAHWTALRMLNQGRDRHDSGGGPSVDPGDYPAELLPYIETGKGGRTFRTAVKSGGGEHIWHARLDLASAYPCVRRQTLASRLDAMLREPLVAARARILGAVVDPDENDAPAWPEEIYRRGDPWRVLETDEGLSVRVELAARWMAMLQAVTYHDKDEGRWSEVDGHWKASALSGRTLGTAGNLFSGDGIPTGLAVSGVWFNVYLHGLDSSMAELVGLTQSTGTVDGAFLRFVDDMVLLAPTQDRLDRLVSGVGSWLEHGSHSPLPGAESNRGWPLDNNLVVSLDKVEPRRSALHLQTHHRAAVDEPDERLPDIVSRLPDCDGRADGDALGPFVTTMVETFSDLGRPTLHELFGSEAGSRLVELHRLVRMNIDDHEVRSDTRMAFAGRRIATTPLPFPEELRGVDGADGRVDAAIKEITRSVRLAIVQAPWKFQLWEAVVRLGIRQLATSEHKGKAWLVSMFGLLGDSGPLAGEPWGPCGSRKSDGLAANAQRLALSFLRAAAMTAFASVFRDLGDATLHVDGNGHPGWRPTHWAFPLMTRDQAVASRRLLRDQLDDLVSAIYGTPGPAEPSWWELDALREARFAVRSPESVSTRIAAQPAERLVARWMRCDLDPAATARLIRRRFADDPFSAARYAHALGVLGLLPEKDLRRCATALANPSQLAGWGVVGEPGAGSPARDWRLLLAYRFARKVHQAAYGLRHPERLWDLVDGLPWTDPGARINKDKSPFRELRGGSELMHLLLPLVRTDDDSAADEVHWVRYDGPAVGLPSNLVLAMLTSALATAAATPTPGSVGGWRIKPKRWVNALKQVRLWQLGLVAEPPDQPLDPVILSDLVVEGVERPRVPPHPLFLLLRMGTIRAVELGPKPFSSETLAFLASLYTTSFFTETAVEADKELTLDRVLAHLLLALVALEGSEAPLDELFDSWPVSMPPSTNMGWRDRYSMPLDFWALLDRALIEASVSREDTRPQGGGESEGGSKQVNRPPFPITTTVAVDLRDGRAPEYITGPEVGRATRDGDDGPLDPVAPPKGNLEDALQVRMAQIERWPNVHQVVSHWPDHPSPLALLRSITEALPFRAPGDDLSVLPAITILPEVTLPVGSAGLVRTTAQRYGYGVLVGRYWRPVSSALYRPHATQRWLSNDAVLVVPIDHHRRPGAVRTFVIRKPFPSHEEYGLARALTEAGQSSVQWRLLPGTRVHRFIHPTWGSFSVGICSDLIDPRPWADLRGRLHHLFFVSMNEDASLFHAMTRSRAYEVYANLVLVNHGLFGGSYAWSPERGHGREKARFDGRGLRVVSDISVPVASLDEAQRNELERATNRSRQGWLGHPVTQRGVFKTPPPGYQHAEDEDD